MNVVPFTPKTCPSRRSWSSHELETLVSIYESHAARGEGFAWDVGATELDDPQFYIIGPAPELDCLVAISRVGRIYVLENGTGHVIDEESSLEALAVRAKMPRTTHKMSLMARIMLGLAALRVTVEEKIEPVLVESEELLLRFVPQLSALV
jgi:hypothetical protein